MQTLREIKSLLESHGLRPNRSLGQNFLIDQNLLRKLADAAGPGEGDLVLEVGPGTGTLTEELLARGARVIACEMDRGLAELLRGRFGDWGDRFELIEGDCLRGKEALHPMLDERLEGERFALVANLPYGAASPLMAILATRYAKSAGAGCTGQFVTIQREVAQRLRASPGTKDYGELGIVVGAVAEVRKIGLAPPSCFWPAPNVTSELIAISPRDEPLTSDPNRLARTCRLLFQQRRKKLSSILHRAGLEPPAGIDVDLRPEQLEIEQIELIGRAMTESEGHHSK